VLAINPLVNIDVDFDINSLSSSTDDILKLDGARVVLMIAYLEGEDKAEWTLNPAVRPYDVCGLVTELTGHSYDGKTIYRRLGVVDILLGFDYTPTTPEKRPNTTTAVSCQHLYSQKDTIVLTQLTSSLHMITLRIYPQPSSEYVPEPDVIV
jgi:hypothetical protein